MNTIQIYEDITINSIPYTIVDRYIYYIVDNVVSYTYNNFNSWNIKTTTFDNVANEKDFYIIIDTEFHDAFIHWVIESSIYLPLFNILKKKYNNLKLILKGPKRYKLLFSNFFNISENDIVYNLSNNNQCFFPNPESALNNNNLTDTFMTHFTSFHKQISMHTSKDIDVLILPRGKTENYIGNDRIVDTTDIELNIIDKPNTIILNTDTIISLNKQIELISRSKNIIVPDGSAFLTNGLFTKGSNIIVLGDFTISQSQRFKKMNYLINTIMENNKVTYIPFIHGSFNNSTFYYKDIEPFLI